MRASCCAQARPAGPEPTIAIRLPVPRGAHCGLIQPSRQPRSTISHSIVLIVTGASSRLSVQAASQGAGQTRPVNSGKLLVRCSRSSAACQSSPVNEVVPVRDEIVHRAAGMAEGNAAIHAALRLARDRSGAGGSTNSLPMRHPLVRRSDKSGRGGRSRGSRSACPFIAPSCRRSGATRIGIDFIQRAAIFERHHLDELAQRCSASRRAARRQRAAGRELVPFEQDAQPISVVSQRMAHAAIVNALRSRRRCSVTPGGPADGFEIGR